MNQRQIDEAILNPTNLPAVDFSTALSLKS